MSTSGLEGGKTTTLHNHYHREQCPCGARRIDAQLGLEKTPEAYVARLVEVMREVRRVLRRDGTLWLNLGDSYAGGGNNRGNNSPLFEKQASNGGAIGQVGWRDVPAGLKPKDLVGIPWRVAFALQADGWWLRSDVVWAKPNPMPESVTDRPTKSHEYIFLLSKSGNYFYDAEAIKEKGIEPLREREAGNGEDAVLRKERGFDNCMGTTGSRNKRSVWTIATQPYPEAHFATFPEEIPKLCILAGTSAKGCCQKCGGPWERVTEAAFSAHDGETDSAYPMGTTANRLALLRQAARERGEEYNGSRKTLGWRATCKCNADIVPCTVLDPFAGSGTTGAVALGLGRRAVLIELNPKYVALIETRCSTTIGLPF